MNTRSKRSIFWILPEEEFKKLISNSTRWKDVFDFFERKNEGGNFKTLKTRIKSLNLDSSHLLSCHASTAMSRSLSREDFITKWLTKESSRNRTQVKNYLIRFKLAIYECAECKSNGTWNNKKLSLQLDHVNGVNNDNNLSNLRFLCPNCHSQTDNFAGKAKGNGRSGGI